MGLGITGKTELIGLIGSPVSHSLSPLMHNWGFQHLGLDYAYLAFDVRMKTLEEGINAMKVLNASGFNVTMPLKQAILPFLDELSEEAALIGAVNTVINLKGRLKGYNTDGMGYVKSLSEEGVSVSKKKFVLAGAGGASRSIAIQLALNGAAEVIILNRDKEKADEICRVIREKISGVGAASLELNSENLSRELKTADVLVNCTPLGMSPDEDISIIEDPEMLKDNLVVSDIVYHPVKTKLLAMAESKGCKTVSGLGMILWQGAYAFEIWTGRKMPVEAVRERMMKELNRE